MSPQGIPIVTRRNIFDHLIAEKTCWHGRLTDIDFLQRLYDLSSMPSTDERCTNALGDIYTHRVSFPTDWDDYWVFSDERFGLLYGEEDKFLFFLCQMLHPVVREDAEEVQGLLRAFNKHLARDGWEIIETNQISNRPVFSARRRSPTTDTIKMARKAAITLDAEYVTRQVARIEESIDKDPDLAIGTAKEFVETLCKTILRERNVKFDERADLPNFVKETSRALQLIPEGVTQHGKAADAIRILLSNLGLIASGLAQLRNLHGTGHGRTATVRGLSSRHARLAAGAATALGVFLFETHQETP